MTITMYGIKNCDTIKKARNWLDSHELAYDFHDYKVIGIDAARIDSWMRLAGWEVLLNKAGTTFRKLLDADKARGSEERTVGKEGDSPGRAEGEGEHKKKKK